MTLLSLSHSIPLFISHSFAYVQYSPILSPLFHPIHLPSLSLITHPAFLSPHLPRSITPTSLLPCCASRHLITSDTAALPPDQPEVRQEGQEATTLVNRFNQLQEERVLTYRRLEE